MLAWKKLSSAKWEDAWLERLCFLDPTRLVISSVHGSKSIRITAYDLTPKQGADLVKQFGGTLFRVNTAQLLGKTPSRPPIRIRKELVVIDSEKERRNARKSFPGRKTIVIPAAMAFGTGDHATTASCLRLLCDVAAKLDSPWRMLDLGTGSGILAIAGRLLGAKQVEATDFDPQAVRVARENLALNKVESITVKKMDVLHWNPTKQWDLVTANLFSSVLIGAAPAISQATRSGGWLILSGILREQEVECVRAFKDSFTIQQAVHRGKWVTLLARRSR